MFKICCNCSKKGNEYLVLMCNNVFVTFDEATIVKVAIAKGYTKRDVYALEVGETIELE